MKNKIKNVLIGLFVIAAIASGIILILFLKPSVGDGAKLLQVRFSNIAGIGIGTRVTLAGRPVGEVKSIEPIKDARHDLVDELGRVYFYQLTLEVDSSVNVYNTDEITIQTTGLLGEKSIAIIPRPPKKGQQLKLITDQIIYANSVESLENALFLISQLATHLNEAVDDIDQWFMENSEDLSMAVRSFGDAMKQIDITLSDVNKEQLVCSIKEAVDGFAINMRLMQDALTEVKDNEMVAKLDHILNNLSGTTDSLNTEGREIISNIRLITQDLAMGQGTLGQLLKNEELYLQLSAIFSKANTMMNDINHYGLLFQYDKHWQRSRTKRANLLNALNSSEQFRNYFQTEVDTISTALARISVLLEKAEDSKQRQCIMNNPNFRNDFADLLRRIESLANSVKLYNESLIDAQQSNCSIKQCP